MKTSHAPIRFATDMNLSSNRMQTISKTDSNCVTDESILEAIIIGNDPAFAEKVHATLIRAGHQDDVKIHWVVKFWPLDALNENAFAEQELMDAAEAHLIVLPTHLAQSSAHWLIGWLGRWAAQRHIPDAALGLIWDDGVKNVSRPLCQELSLLILEHGLNLITDPNPAPGRPTRLAVDFSPEQEIPLAVVPAKLAEPGRYNSYRAMGINE